MKINDRNSINLARLIPSKLFIYANSGYGKSWLLRRLIEQSYGKIQQIILDTEGEFASLREKYDFVLIGKGYDIAADPKTAALLAHRLLKEKVSANIDLFELDPKDRELFVENFTKALTNAPKDLWHPCMIVYDEAQDFAPERGTTSKGMACTEAIITFAKKSRKRGFCPVFATQRISDLSKSVIATCNNKLIGQASLDADMKRAASELGFTTKEQVLAMRDLEPGEFYAFGPAISKEIIKLKVGPVMTSHPDSSKIGGRIGTKVVPPSDRVRKILADLVDLPRVAAEEARTIADFKKQLAEANHQIRALQVKAKDSARISGRPSKEDMERWDKEAYDRGFKIGEKTNLAILKKMLEKMNKEGSGSAERYNKAVKAFTSIEKIVKPFSDSGVVIYSGTSSITPFLPSLGKIDTIEVPDRFLPLHNPPMKNLSKPLDESIPFPPGTVTRTDIDMNDLVEVKLGKGEIAVLTAVAQHDGGISREHLTAVTGYKKSTRNRYLQYLQAKEYVKDENDRIFLTTSGAEALGPDYIPLPTGADLLDHLLKTLPEGEKKILGVLAQSDPSVGLHREEISNLTGYKKSTRNRYIQHLQARELVSSSGDFIIPSAKLFE